MTEQTNVANTQEAPAVAAPTISIPDLQLAVRIIDLACENGAFKGWALLDQVRANRDKINSFVVASMPPVEKEVAKPAKAKKEVAKEVAKAAPKAAAKTSKAPVKKVTAAPVNAKASAKPKK